MLVEVTLRSHNWQSVPLIVIHIRWPDDGFQIYPKTQVVERSSLIFFKFARMRVVAGQQNKNVKIEYTFRQNIIFCTNL